ncbi:BAH domain-containing protein [Pleurostoma richardsiae]|uniref:BAH domain-containing protein n=1 Tax=Pleurostoma richardsiae TaxID=41990 RepID=A0AA38S7I9_9PEZI|nr:BAH domain-containing protein [Pleurostoma richardsiae]
MTSARKRPRTETEEARAECPFVVRPVDPREKEQKKKKRRRNDDEPDEGDKKVLLQMSPFSPAGKFKTYDTMDVHYTVEPAKKWSEMTRYNSFVLNGVKYFSEGFIYVANDATIERQKAISNKEQLAPRLKSDDEWVARILEIRASDEHHVYARIFWMYWPDELPANTHDGKKLIQGRQPYHGTNELVASNHMDIINVVSVTQQATVNQWFEDNDEDIMSALYWRQALDTRTMELSSIEALCKCDTPGNPDKVLIGCSNSDCGKWLHEECIKHEALTKTYERLGRDKPHKAPETEPSKEAKEPEEPKRPLSPTETGAGIVANHSIDVKADGAADAVKVNDNVDVKRVEDDESAAAQSQAHTAKEHSVSTDTPRKGTPARKVGRPKKKTADRQQDEKPYEGLFEAALLMDLNPPMLEIRDLREGIEGGEKSWKEEIKCLLCGSQIH